jgi:hypothetical protein
MLDAGSAEGGYAATLRKRSYSIRDIDATGINYFMDRVNQNNTFTHRAEI